MRSQVPQLPGVPRRRRPHAGSVRPAPPLGEDPLHGQAAPAGGLPGVRPLREHPETPGSLRGLPGSLPESPLRLASGEHVQEFADFLGSQPPFDALSAGDLTRLARQVEVEYFAAGTVIVPADAQPLDHLYVIRTGAVEIADRGRTVDLLGPGDTFGHISVLTGLPPALSARAAEDTLCYRLPDPRQVVTDPSALQFSHFGTMIARDRLTGHGLLTEPQTPVTRHMRAIVWCDAATSVRAAAEAVSRADQSCALVQARLDVGRLLDREFGRLGAAEDIIVKAPVPANMTVNPSTVASTA